jgi:CDI immunity protein
MLYENIFEGIQYDRDDYWVVKEFFNTLNNFLFHERVSILLKGIGQATEHADCFFSSDLKDEQEEVHEGVLCSYFDDSVIIPEKDFMHLLKIACQRYLIIHPDSIDRLKIEKIVSTL